VILYAFFGPSVYLETLGLHFVSSTAVFLAFFYVSLRELRGRAPRHALLAGMAAVAIPFVQFQDLLPKIAYLVCAGYKHLLSPRGTAYFYVRPDRWDHLEAYNANWRAADQPFNRYFGGPLSLSETAD
jgi:hypothetical protein